ncbi:sugar phosphate isomerase/epimerase family protein [Aestuariimicrobium ganziense]|uniref:sugar phosphate isomerase/epimerase family protein n=1 Tax=Aestuariimicrobium ganziense TaxID=2773677 RepID=UPI0019438389|nr:sugar phosphate isomerase/epimerase [Aestuariimicrobium ganziense]
MSTPEISVQLYSIHPELAADLDGSLAKIADIGLTTVEAFDFVTRVDELKAAFDKYGLKSPTAHAILIEDAGVATPDGLLSVPPVEETFEAAKKLGVEVVIDPFVAPAKWQTAEDVTRTATKLNERAVQARDYGLKVGYHNHEHEFTAEIDGRPAYDLFVEQLDPDVKLEVDLYWAQAGGADLIELLTRLGDRVIAVHSKDGPLRPGTTAANLPKDQAPAGQGDVKLADVFAADLDIPYAVIEFDHYEGDTFDGITQSYAWLKETLG